MGAPQQAPLPPFFDLGDGMLVRITAVDAATGAVVPDVVISNVSLAVDPTETESPAPTDKPGPIFLLPGPAVLPSAYGA